MESKSQEKYDFIVACIGNNEFDEGIIDNAYKKSRLDGCKWVVLNITRKKVDAYSQSKVQRMIKKAMILKAETVKLQAPSVSEGIIQYAKSLDVKDKSVLFIVGTQRVKHFYSFIFKSTSQQIKSQLKNLNINLNIITRERDAYRNYAFISPMFNFDAFAGMAEAIICVLVAFIISFFENNFLPFKTDKSLSNIYIIYFFACMIPSIRGGFIPGILAAVLSVVTIHFFFLQPVSHFSLYDLDDVYNLFIFFTAVSAVSLICSGSRRYIIEARQKEAYLNALLNVSETLNRHLNENEALDYIYHELEKLFATEIALYTPAFMDNNRLNLAYPSKIEKFSASEKSAFDICRTDFRSTGFLTSTNSEAKWYFEPMMSPDGFQGILAVKLAASPLRYDSNIISILLGFADLCATIINRIEHTQTLEETRVKEEKEKLRTMILSSVSHDLKTPLASIIGSLDVYHNLGEKLSKEAKRELTQTSLQEAQRLDSFITNILDMAKLESGSVKLNKEWHPVLPLIDKSLDMASNKLGKRIRNVDGENYEIEVDQNMLMRALAHLFDNISKYTPDNSGFTIEVKPEENNKFSILVRDTGPGIEEGMLESIFNKYTRIQKRDSKIAGTGLGLPISKSIVESHGGTISAYNNKNGVGAAFKIILPNYRSAA